MYKQNQQASADDTPDDTSDKKTKTPAEDVKDADFEVVEDDK